MKRLLLSTSIVALLLSSTAFAWPGHDNGKGHAQSHAHPERGNNPKAQGRHDNGLHLGQQKQAWKRGQRLPQAYLVDRYYVNDYRAHRLQPPPRGYRWVRPYPDSNEFLLVQITTGIISEILGN